MGGPSDYGSRSIYRGTIAGVASAEFFTQFLPKARIRRVAGDTAPCLNMNIVNGFMKYLTQGGQSDRKKVAPLSQGAGRAKTERAGFSLFKETEVFDDGRIDSTGPRSPAVGGWHPFGRANYSASGCLIQVLKHSAIGASSRGESAVRKDFLEADSEGRRKGGIPDRMAISRPAKGQQKYTKKRE